MSENTNRKPAHGGPMSQGGVAEKSKDFKGSWGRLINYCKSYLPVIIFALILAMAGVILQIVEPDKLKYITNEVMKGLPTLVNGQPVIGQIDMSAIANIGILLVFLYTSSALLNFLQNFIMATITQKISRNIRSGISQKINKLPLKYFDKESQGDVLSKVTNDVDTIGQTMNQSIGTDVL